MEQVLEIETTSLVLRHFKPEDAAEVQRQSNEPSSRLGLPSQVCADADAARELLDYLIGQYAEPGDPRSGPYVLAVDHRTDSTLIGHVGLSPLDGQVEIGFAIAEAYQRRGLAVEAVKAACDWAFDRFGLSSILAIAAQANGGSRKVLVRAGFEYQSDRTMCFQGTDQKVSEYYLTPPP